MEGKRKKREMCLNCWPQVTEFLYRCAKASNSLQTPLTSSGEGGVTNSSGGVARKLVQPVTLFSSGHMRAEVAVQLMLRSQDILEGFELAHSIVTVSPSPSQSLSSLFFYLFLSYLSLLLIRAHIFQVIVLILLSC